MEPLLEFFRKVQPVSPELQSYLVSIVRYKCIRRKDFLLKAGHHCQFIYFIEKGLLRCYYVKGKAEICSWIMKEKDMIASAESFYLRQPSYEFIQALEDCELYYISYDELYHIYRHFPEFNYTGRELMQGYYLRWVKQLYGLRMQQAPERYAWLVDHHPDLLQRVPAKYLASFLGITEVMLSKVKGRR